MCKVAAECRTFEGGTNVARDLNKGGIGVPSMKRVRDAEQFNLHTTPCSLSCTAALQSRSLLVILSEAPHLEIYLNA